MNTRLLLLGLDGATFKILLPFVEAGILPNLKKIMDAGCWGNLISTVPPLTSPAWAVMMTGKNPAKIGVFSFHDVKVKDYKFGYVNSSHIEAKMFWEIAGESGKKVNVINYPFTYPPRQVSGRIISGFMTPPDVEDYFYPSDLRGLLMECDYPRSYPPSPSNMDEYEAFMEQLLDGLSKRVRLAELLAKENDSDLFMFCFQEPDYMHHFVWKFIDPTFDEYRLPQAEKIREYFKRVYTEIDKSIGRITAILNPEIIMLSSDHGSAAVGKTYFNINKLLAKNGLIKPNLYGFHRKLYKASPKFLKGTIKKKYADKIEDIDYSKTKIIPLSYSKFIQLFINVKGRFPMGTVEPGGAEYNEILGQAVRLFKDIKNGGDTVVDRIYGKEIYNGTYMEYAPDLTIILKEGYDAPSFGEFKNDLRAKGFFTKNTSYSKTSGGHDFEGIYIIAGDGVKAGGRSSDQQIASIAPTALHMLGLPVPNDMDGEVIVQAIDDNVLKTNPVAYSDALASEYHSYSTGEKDEKATEEQLRALGYI